MYLCQLHHILCLSSSMAPWLCKYKCTEVTLLLFPSNERDSCFVWLHSPSLRPYWQRHFTPERRNAIRCRTSQITWQPFGMEHPDMLELRFCSVFRVPSPDTSLWSLSAIYVLPLAYGSHWHNSTPRQIPGFVFVSHFEECLDSCRSFCCCTKCENEKWSQTLFIARND